VLHDLFREALDERLRKRFPDELRSCCSNAPRTARRIRCAVSAILLRAGEFGEAEGVLADASERLLLEGGAGEVRRADRHSSPVDRRAASPAPASRGMRPALAHEGQWVEMVGACEAGDDRRTCASDNEVERQLAHGLSVAGALRNAGRLEACVACCWDDTAACRRLGDAALRTLLAPPNVRQLARVGKARATARRIRAAARGDGSVVGRCSSGGCAGRRARGGRPSAACVHWSKRYSPRRAAGGLARRDHD
jgi:hypothetical protein